MASNREDFFRFNAQIYCRRRGKNSESKLLHLNIGQKSTTKSRRQRAPKNSRLSKKML